MTTPLSLCLQQPWLLSCSLNTQGKLAASGLDLSGLLFSSTNHVAIVHVYSMSFMKITLLVMASWGGI